MATLRRFGNRTGRLEGFRRDARPKICEMPRRFVRRARLRHCHGTTTALPRHCHGTITAPPRHHHGTTAALPRHAAPTRVRYACACAR